MLGFARRAFSGTRTASSMAVLRRPTVAAAIPAAAMGASSLFARTKSTTATATPASSASSSSSAPVLSALQYEAARKKALDLPVRTAADAPIGTRPVVSSEPPKSIAEYNNLTKSLKRYIEANRQVLPRVAPKLNPRPWSTPLIKPRNKKESKLFKHIRRVRLTRSRALLPAPTRPYFPPIRVNHTPKGAHVHEPAASEAVAAHQTRVAKMVRAAANAEPGSPLPRNLLPHTPAYAGLLEGKADAAPQRFAIFDLNSKQHKVVEGGKLMTGFLKDVNIGDKLQFDRVLLVASKLYTVIGRPFIPAAKVTATVEEHTHTRHMTIFKKHRRKGYRKTQGARNQVTLLRIDTIDYNAENDKDAEVLKARPLPTYPDFASTPKPVTAVAAAKGKKASA